MARCELTKNVLLLAFLLTIARGVVRQFNDYLNANLKEEDKTRLTQLLKKVNALTVDYQP